MLLVGGSSFEETLSMMGKEDENSSVKAEDVEEGEISDTASVEEISEEDFKKQDVVNEVVVVKESKPKDSRVWTMNDLYKYRGGYVSSLYNLAWAQAVQNKPLNELFLEVEQDENSKRSSPSSSIASVNSKEERKVEKIVIDDSGDEIEAEKEEGELEEGEIDLDSDPVEKVNVEAAKEMDFSNNDEMDIDNPEYKENELLEKKKNSIREVLESVTVFEAQKSFEGVCSRLKNTLESLRKLVWESNVHTKDFLVQLLFTATKAVNLAFCSMDSKLKEQNKDLFSSLLFMINEDPPLFSTEQIKEIEVMASMDSDILPAAICGEKEKGTQASHWVNDKYSAFSSKNATHDWAAMNKLPLAARSFVHAKPNLSLEVPKPGAHTFKSRGVLRPLLDLHKDHDVDSLPSPTREATHSLPLQRLLTAGDGKPGMPKPKMAPKIEGSRLHSYETDALKAVSSYQQKFGRGSLFMSDRLPSPTPSEDSDNGDHDTSGEVSSSSNASNVRSACPPSLSQPIAPPSPTLSQTIAIPPPTLSQSIVPPSFTLCQPIAPSLPALSKPDAPHPTTPCLPIAQSSVMHGAVTTRDAAQLSSVSGSTVKSSGRSRDPRLRHINYDASALDQNQQALPVVHNIPKAEPLGGITGLGKQKSAEDSLLDGPSLKRQRNTLENSSAVRDVKAVTGSGGWLEDTDVTAPQSINRNQLAENAKSDPRRMDNGVTGPNIVANNLNLTVSVNEEVPATGTSNIAGSENLQVTGAGVASLPDILKDIAVNPKLLMDILKMGQQQKLLLDTQQKPVDPRISTRPPSSNSILGAVPVVNVAPPQSLGILPRPLGTPQVPSQIAAPDELGKVRMKPRDPRRVLHNNVLQRTGSLGSEQLKTNIIPAPTTQGLKDSQNTQKQDGQVEMKPVPVHSFVPPDISMQFTKSLKNIAEIVSVSQTSTTTPLVSQTNASQPVQNKSEKLDIKAAMSNADQQTVTPAPVVAAAASSSQNTWGDVEHLFQGYDDQQKAAIQRERSRRIEEQKKMFTAHKLCLVLDLDHTLLNSAKFNEIDPVHEEILRKKEEQDRDKPQRHLFRFTHMGMWTKLRPGIWNFLEKASKLFELHLYTMGNKIYATEMAKVLDPKGVLFNGRVISKGDDADPFDGDERVHKSKDLEGVLGMESAVVIIDDSVRVWPHNKLNLIVVERYIFFPCSRRQFGLPGPSLLEIDHDERPEDGTLACSLAVIERIHQNFFSHQSLDEADVRNILASEQRKILAGCRIVFSRVFPVGEANPHLHPLWQTAEQFGAVCTNQIDEQVTHVVANSLGTDKVNWALSSGRFVVHPGWVEASALLYRRANEQDFAIKP